MNQFPLHLCVFFSGIIKGLRLGGLSNSGTRLSLTPDDRKVTKFVGDTYVISCLNGASDTQWIGPFGQNVNDSRIRYFSHSHFTKETIFLLQ